VPKLACSNSIVQIVHNMHDYDCRAFSCNRRNTWCKLYGMEEFLTVEEAAQQLRVSPDTIRRFLRDKKLRGVRVGGQWRIPTDAVQAVYLPLGEILEEQIVTLTARDVNGVTIPAGTLFYIVGHSRGTGGDYSDDIRVRETPTWLPGGTTNRYPDIQFPLSQLNQSWKYVPNDGARSLRIPRVVLQQLRTLLNTAYSAATDTNRQPLEEAYLIVRTALGQNDRTDEDAINQALEARMEAVNKAIFQSAANAQSIAARR
jgi:excisionase family DNA binding protein